MMKAIKNFMNDWFKTLGYACTCTAVTSSVCVADTD